MPYSPPLVKPLLPPLRPPAPFPYRPPGPNRLPPPQPAPIYQPPDLLPPTGIDLKGVVCIYANTPLWEPKKIRYRYPGENWQEIAGDRYTLGSIPKYPLTSYVSDWLIYDVTYTLEALRCSDDKFLGIGTVTFPNRVVTARQIEELIPHSPMGSRTGGNITTRYRIKLLNVSSLTTVTSNQWPSLLRNNACNRYLTFNYKIKDLKNNQDAPLTQCVFKVFNIFNQEILSITRDDCPEVIVVPERCYYKAENERLVRKVDVGTFQNLRTEYNGNCATVWLDAPPLPFATEMYKECSDNPNCPPPKIRFDKKCEEKCEQCPPGTAIKVLLGGNIACVDSVGCVLKTVKYKPGCNSYDCICG